MLTLNDKGLGHKNTKYLVLDSTVRDHDLMDRCSAAASEGSLNCIWHKNNFGLFVKCPQNYVDPSIRQKFLGYVNFFVRIIQMILDLQHIVC